MAEQYPRATHSRRVCVSLSRAYVTYVPILRCVHTHVVNGAYTVNSETRSRAPVVIKKTREVWLLFVTCGTVILQACSKYRLRKAVAPEEYAWQCLSLLLSHRRIAQCSKGIIDSSVNVSKGCFCTPAKMKCGHCLRSSRSRDCSNARWIPRSPAPPHARLRL